MPFSKYFQDDAVAAAQDSGHELHFQLPSFFNTGAPMLAPGGGAEVLTFNSTWFANNNGCYSEGAGLGLPVYSASGFDVLSMLARVVGRANARVALGPVDMTCSFVVVDVRRHDQPIVYCSPSFCRLTGYGEHEVLGRNCRFLQAPPSAGPVRAGEARRFTSQASVDSMRRALVAHKEVQTSIVNFRKDGSAFINLVSVVPLDDPAGCSYHVGFQADLTEQPARPHTAPDVPAPPPPRKHQLPAPAMARALALALASPALHRHLPVSTATTAPVAAPANNPLSLILLEYAPDFVLVVSLKGAFLYVAPAVAHVLGHDPSDLVGRSVSDLAHPEDVVPLERQLKESSSLVSDGHHQHAKLIDVLFRARTARASYVWVEARGRLHVEPGKGRKAIVLSARARRMPRVRWADLLPPLPTSNTCHFWAQLSGIGAAAGAFVSLGNGVESALGYRPADVIGRRISALVVDDDRHTVDRILRQIERPDTDPRVVVFVRATTDTGQVVRVRLAFYPTQRDESDEIRALGIAPPVVLLHVARGEGIDILSTDQPQLHDPDENVFAELDVKRGSSWQYELQQLRFRNSKLREEVRALEREIAGESATSATRAANSYPTAGNSYAAGKPYAAGNSYAAGNPYSPAGKSYPPANFAEHESSGYDTHYTAALDRYAATDGGVAYDDFHVPLEVDMGGMGMQTSYDLPQSPLSSFHIPHDSNQYHQQQTMYAPQPIHSSSGLLHALGPLPSSLHFQQSHRRPPMTRPYDTRRGESQLSPGAMHPGVKRAFGR